MLIDQIKYIAPEISLLCFALLIVMVDLFVSRKGVLPILAVIGALVAAAFTLGLWGSGGTAAFNNMIAIDQFGLFFKLLDPGRAGPGGAGLQQIRLEVR